MLLVMLAQIVKIEKGLQKETVSDDVIQDGVEKNDTSTIIEQERQEDNIPLIQMNTPIGKQSIVQSGLAVVQELLTID
jgi:hypothetical protein